MNKIADKAGNEQGVAATPPPATPVEKTPPSLPLDWTRAPHPFALVAKDVVRGTQRLAEMQRPDCGVPAKTPLSLRVKVASPFGEHLVRMQIYLADNSEESAAPGTTALRARRTPRRPQANVRGANVRGAKARGNGKQHPVQTQVVVPPPPPVPVTTGPFEEIEAEADGQKMHLAASEALFAPLRQAACTTTSSANASIELVLDARVADALRDVMQRIAPDCSQLVAGANGYVCQLPAANPELARQELNGIRTTMLQRWSRQPYLLTRRLAVGLTLANALRSQDMDHQLNNLCAVVKYSLPIELTATIASRRWQAAVCDGKTPNRRDAALFGLAKTVAEIDFLRQLFERTSKLGTLTLRIPAQKAPYNNIWVSLVPEGDVAETLTRETARLWLTDANIATPQPEDLPRSCWHPVYAESARLMLLARHLTLAGDGGSIACEDAPLAPQTAQAAQPAPGQSAASGDALPDPRSLARYIADSITSETEFVMENQRAKTLRLPVGRYRYALRGLPDDPAEWDDAAQAEPQSSGVIEWDRKLPRPAIMTW